MRHIALLTIMTLAPLAAFAQRENSKIRSGNNAYNKSDYKGAEVQFRDALQINGDSYAAKFNLGNALYRQQQVADATALWSKLAQIESLSKGEVAAANYNIGTAQLKEREIDQAIESLKQALRLDPNNREAKYNLAYAQKLKKEEDGGGGQDNKQDQQDNKQDQQDKQQDKDNAKNQQQQPGQKPESREQAERMADAIQRSEDRTKEKVDKERVKKVESTGGKSW